MIGRRVGARAGPGVRQIPLVRPQAVADEAVAGAFRTFWRRGVFAAEIAKAWRPGQRHHIIVELGGRDGGSGRRGLRKTDGWRPGDRKTQTQRQFERKTRHSAVPAFAFARSLRLFVLMFGEPLRFADFALAARPDDLA